MNKICDICNSKHDYIMNYVEIDSVELLNAIAKLNPTVAEEFHGSELHICDECYKELFTYCSICHSSIVKGTLCDCAGEHILPYTNKVTIFPKYNGHVKFPKLRFGLEIETEFKGSWNKRTRAFKEFTHTLGKGLCKFKKDGSLGRKGAEFVSMPMYYEHICSLKGKFTRAFKNYANAGGYSWSTPNTGVHIHLSRKAFLNREHIKNFILGIITDKNFTRRIAKRGSNFYCKHPREANEFYGCGPLENVARLIAYDECDYGRHTFVNCLNEDTIEVRVYKGNIKWSSVVVYLQHCYSMFEYSLLLTLNKIDFSVEGYRKYVLNNKARFPELAKEI